MKLALQHREMRAPMTLGLAVTAVLYMLCLCAALWTAKAAWLLAVRPGLGASVGHLPASGAVAALSITLMGAPVLWMYVRLMYRVAGRSMGPRAKRKASGDV